MSVSVAEIKSAVSFIFCGKLSQNGNGSFAAGLVFFTFMDSFTRRRFLEGSAALLGVTIAGCASKDAPAPQSRAGAGGSISVTGLGALEAGQALTFTFPNGDPGLVFKTASGKSGAVSAKCTHLGCTVAWSGDAKTPLHCPCHNSNFALDGQVLSGPAKAPLKHYSVSQSGEEIILSPL